MKKNKKKAYVSKLMPSLTIDGKREIIARALAVVGEPALLVWLAAYNVTSVQFIYEHVRKFKAKFFRELFAMTVRESAKGDSAHG